MAKSLTILLVAAFAGLLLFFLLDRPGEEPPVSPPPDSVIPVPATPPAVPPVDPESALPPPPPENAPAPEPPGPAHTGTVVDTADRPVAGAYVTFEWSVAAAALWPDPRPRKAYVRTDEKGRFRYAGPGPLAARHLYAAHPDFGVGLTSRRDATMDPPFEDVVIRLDPGLRIDFAVRTGEGARPEQVKLTLQYGKRDPWAPIEGLTRAHFREMTRTGADFSFPGLSGEPFTLWLSVDGFIPRRYASEDVLPGPRRVEVVLDRGLAVSGTLLDREGKPVVGATLHVNTGNREDQRANPFYCRHGKTDEQGRFEVAGLADATFLIRAHAPGAKTSVTVAEGIRAGTTGLALRIPAE